MPTGYTAKIKDGITFKEFAWGCARAFGALVMMRDDPSDAPIPEKFEPSDHHSKKIAEERARTKELLKFSVKRCDLEATKAHAQAVASNGAALKDCSAQRVKYDAMLDQVKAWVPPTPDHQGMKDFMIQQITDSVKFDCSESYYHDNAPKNIGGAAWREKQLAESARSITYHLEGHEKEVTLANQRNKWIADLRKSLT